MLCYKNIRFIKLKCHAVPKNLRNVVFDMIYIDAIDVGGARTKIPTFPNNFISNTKNVTLRSILRYNKKIS